MTKTVTVNFGVINFPGSNCENDTVYVISQVLGSPVKEIWHKESSLEGIDILFIPGGFSYGDSLRCGAIARFSPIMKSVIEFASRGGIVVGICNGFQVLLESGLLPGALIGNSSCKFICESVYLKVARDDIPATRSLTNGDILDMPIAHHDGNYFCDSATLNELKKNRQIVLQYCDKNGIISDEANPNGSISNIAGICNKEGNVFGLMPHPERNAEKILGNSDGLKLFTSLISA